MDASQRRETNKGFGDGLQQAFELVMTPAIFGVLGYVLDRWIGTVPLFTVLFTLGVLGYEAWRLIVAYGAEMDSVEEGKPWNRTRSTSEQVVAE